MAIIEQYVRLLQILVLLKAKLVGLKRRLHFGIQF